MASTAQPVQSTLDVAVLVVAALVSAAVKRLLPDRIRRRQVWRELDDWQRVVPTCSFRSRAAYLRMPG